MHSAALYSLILVTNINRKGNDFCQPTFKGFHIKGKRIFMGFNHQCELNSGSSKRALFHSLKYLWIFSATFESVSKPLV